jgi:hypothetical protein
MTDDTQPIGEVVTLYSCHGCEMADIAGNAERIGHVSDGEGDQLGCANCGARLNAECFFDYVDIRVVDYI